MSEMSEAIRSQLAHVAQSQRIDRSGWTHEQWVTDARRLMGDLDGSVLDLVNGHITALFHEIDRLREAKGTAVVQAASDIASGGILPFERALKAVMWTTDLWTDYQRLKDEEDQRLAGAARGSSGADD